MNEEQILNMWKSYDLRLERAISLNKKNFEEIQKLKASSALKSLRGNRWIGIIVGFIWLLFIGFLIVNSLSLSKIFFVASLSIHFVVSLMAVIVYIRHLVLIDQFDNSETIVEAQQKLVMLNTSNLRILGILILQLPVFSTFYMNFAWMHDSPSTFWFIQVPVVLLEAFIGGWCFMNLRFKNHQKKWFKWLMKQGEFRNIRNAAEFLDEITLFKEDAQ